MGIRLVQKCVFVCVCVCVCVIINYFFEKKLQAEKYLYVIIFNYLL